MAGITALGGGAQQARVLAVMDAFLALQHERAAAYHRFNDGFKTYLEDLKEGPYRDLMAAATDDFQALSLRALHLEAELRDVLHRPDAADIVQTVQRYERDKLQATLSLQAVRGAVANQRFSWQHEGGEGHTCGACSGISGCGHGSTEPTEADIKGATQESYQLLEESVSAINEAITEMQQLRTELLEES